MSQIKDKTALADFLKKQGCEASVDDFAKFIKSQQGEGEIGDDAAAAVAGGFDFRDFWDFLELEWLFG